MQLCRKLAASWVAAVHVLSGVPAFAAAANILKSGSSHSKMGLYPGIGGEPLVNPWAKSRDLRILDDLKPTAPFDRVDREGMASVMGDAPLGPGEKGFNHPEGMAVYEGVKSDYVPPYQHPNPFPYEAEDTRCKDSRQVPLADRVVVGKADRLRPYGAYEWRPSVNYPLVAPMDRIRPGPHPVASEDRIADKYAKYFEQLYDGEQRRIGLQYLVDALKTADTDGDGSISRDEFDGVVEGHQKKSKDEADRLWGRYHMTLSEDMNAEEFIAMANDGFDLGYVNRSDVGMVLMPQCPASFGFWGGGLACQNGSFVIGASIQVKPIAEGNASVDNTALNNIKLVCDDGSEIQSMGNDEGEWSEVGQCPEGQKMYGFSARNQPFGPGRDNTGLNDIKFLCRSEDLNNISTIRFGDKNGPEGQGESKDAIWVPLTVANEGGWGPEFNCGSSGLICGIQTRVQLAGEANETALLQKSKAMQVPKVEENPLLKDAMGITDMRVFCCDKPLNCTVPCQAPGGQWNQPCQSCLERQQGSKPQSR
eukprot:gnl/MRDRNA2_/MRDRNA2_114025_c0_seq1.p1 gnl/MRDRNA2_/MRDRNA2_114025_c0~~gnl/MRDRNA2_/MRDRNA2_114025_c0_seq1.p1  ORF type:complete len:535 (+),score=107.54 gnl/MRDRNA2_/MRDRNA2_114025_c0_seq1:72-1676(+)